MGNKSIHDLLQEGWQRQPGAKLSYISPLGKIINRKRDLAPGDQIYGDELFPGKRKVSRVTIPAPLPIVITASLSSQDTAHVPHTSTNESSQLH